jgi:hypothetical protein
MEGFRHAVMEPPFSRLKWMVSPDGQKLNMTMRHCALPWWNYRPQELWEHVHSERCSSAAKCEAATHARIWLDKGNVKFKRVSGKYDVDFGGQHLEGTFLVKYRK